LNNCEREPIHIPSAIQPHGFLLEISLDNQIFHCSDNIADFLGYKAIELFTNGFQSIAPELLNTIQSFPGILYEPSGIFKPIQVLFNHKNGEKLSFETIISKSNNGYLIECERVSKDQDSENISYNLLSSIMNVRDEVELNYFLMNVSAQIRNITAYDRVMVYRFDPDWNGEVIAESKREDLLPYLGLYYPASDIPVQARNLYHTNLMRMIVDVNYTPSSILKHPTLSDDGILDQSYSVLRSVSPIHIEYLMNMGVSGTLVVSIIIQGKLWGLIACHHTSSAKYISFAVRNSILLMTQFTSLKIESFQTKKKDQASLTLANIRNILLEQMSSATEFLNGLVHGKVTLMDFIECTGAAVKLGDQMLTIGEVPDSDTINKLIKTFEKQLDSNNTFTSNSISSIDPSLQSLKDTVSGILMTQVQSTYNLTLLWFRKERLHTITWSGDPHKAVTVDGKNIERLHPRKSFEAWSEEVKLSCLPWQDLDIQAAIDFKNAIKGTILQKFNEISSLFSEIDLIRFREEKANTSLKEKEILLKEIHHRVKNNMQVIIAMLYMQSDFHPDPDVKQALIESQNRIKAMSIIHEILYSNESLSFIDIHDYFSDLINHLSSSNVEILMPEIFLNVQGLRFAIETAIPCGLILNEAVTNIFKYAFPDSARQKTPKINITLSQIGDRIDFSISDNGIGFPEGIDLQKPKSLGLTLIFALSKQIEGNLNYMKSEDGGAKIKIDFSADRIYKAS